MTVVYLEPLGTGKSGRLRSHPDGYVRTLYADVIARLLDHLRVERVHLLGHSHGGFVAQRFGLDPLTVSRVSSCMKARLQQDQSTGPRPLARSMLSLRAMLAIPLCQR